MNPHTPFVIDSSVIVKWLCKEGEDHCEEANTLLDDLQERRRHGYAPELSHYEVANVLLCGKQMIPRNARNALELLHLLPLTFVPETHDTALLTYVIAHEHALTYYDATFLALAKLTGGTLITDDFRQQITIDGITILPLAEYASDS
jgi:predicted nucleic acid-binding protein